MHKNAPMPTVMGRGPYRFYFFSEEGMEPEHIHVRFEGNDCKFWLNPVIVASNRGIPIHRLNEIERTIHEHKSFLIEKYNEHLSRQH